MACETEETSRLMIWATSGDTIVSHDLVARPDLGQHVAD